jgi:hypothetical protein
MALLDWPHGSRPLAVALPALGSARVTLQYRTEEVGCRLKETVKWPSVYDMVDGGVRVCVNLHDTPPSHHLSHEHGGQETNASSNPTAMGNRVRVDQQGAAASSGIIGWIGRASIDPTAFRKQRLRGNVLRNTTAAIAGPAD